MYSDAAHPENSVRHLQTPCLLLDRQKLVRNAERMRASASKAGVAFRPHLKTAKNIDAARLAMTSPEGPATVSTLKEAEYFAGHGVRDILYAVGIAPQKLGRVLAIRGAGCDLSVILDSVEAAQAAAGASKAAGHPIPAMIEIDSDGHRAGVKPDDAAALHAIGSALSNGALLKGVMTHAGSSYGDRVGAGLQQTTLSEQQAVLQSAAILRSQGFACPAVSVGSTPTVFGAEILDGVTEVRAGVYMFFDLVMAGIGVCALDDIALSVLAAVIGHRREKGWIVTDAGWMALSRDRGTAKQPVDRGYGVVTDLSGKLYPGLIVADANQEHGILALRPGSRESLPQLPLGTMVRILPNHACATAAQHDRYHVLDGGEEIAEIWPRFSGW